MIARRGCRARSAAGRIDTSRAWVGQRPCAGNMDVGPPTIYSTSKVGALSVDGPVGDPSTTAIWAVVSGCKTPSPWSTLTSVCGVPLRTRRRAILYDRLCKNSFAKGRESAQRLQISPTVDRAIPSFSAIESTVSPRPLSPSIATTSAGMVARPDCLGRCGDIDVRFADSGAGTSEL